MFFGTVGQGNLWDPRGGYKWMDLLHLHLQLQLFSDSCGVGEGDAVGGVVRTDFWTSAKAAAD